MTKRVAVLGAGIMGACLAIFLARRGFDVTVFEAAPAPLRGASCWNEGKIHLGYLYAADPSLATARRLIPGGLAFAPLLEQLIGPLRGVTEDDDRFLIHRASVVSADDAGAYFNAVSALVREASNAKSYLRDTSAAAASPLTRSELSGCSNEIVAGFRVPERSISTPGVADRLAAALLDQPRVTARLNTAVTRVSPVESEDGAWRVHTADGDVDTFDWVMNALWHGRLAVDATAGPTPRRGWSHRYRVSAFVRTRSAVPAPNIVISVGPFGDVKNYGRQTFYASWYPAGLLAEGHDIAPPTAPVLDSARRSQILFKIETHLGALVPSVRDIFANAETIDLEGGYVFADGKGSLADPAATIHRRSQFGVTRRGRYISIDTGKYSTAPLMALHIAEAIAAG